MKTHNVKLTILHILVCLGLIMKQSVSAGTKAGYATMDSIQMAYPFELKDKEGKVVRMEDFKGKVVVLDFWYTRCIPCLVLAEPLAQIREYYKGNPDVVFIDINLDEDTDQWKNSLAQGTKLGNNETLFYTDSLSLSVSTAPLGFNNPMNEFYKIKGVPTWIIVGKKGEILERNPPRPLPEKNGIESAGSLRFKALINEYLLSSSKKVKVQ